jgi:hypothetical protein
VIVEGRAGATSIGVTVISGAGEEGDERLKSCKSQISGNLGVVESTYHVILCCEIDDFRTSFPLPFQDVTKRRKVIVVIVGILTKFNV